MVAKVAKKKPPSKSMRHDDVPASVGLVKKVRKELRAEIQGARHELGAKIEKTIVAVHRVEVLMEEQRGENRIVLDGLKLFLERQDRVESTLSRHSLL